ncbi:MAG: ABC transporter ATP-binding protein [Clostridium sp.]
MFKLTKKYIFKFSIFFILILILLLSESGFTLWMPYIIKDTIDKGVTNLNFNITLKYASLLLFATFSYATLSVLSSYVLVYLETRIIEDLRNTVFKHILNFSFNNINNFPNSTLFTRITNDTSNIGTYIGSIALLYIYYPFIIVSSMYMLYNIHSRLTLIFIFSAPLIIFILILFLKFFLPIFKTIQKTKDKINNFIEENISLIKEIKSYTKEQKEIKKFEKINYEYMTIFQKSVFRIIFFMLILEIGFVFLNVLVVKNATIYILDGSLSIGDLIAYTSIIAILLNTFYSYVTELENSIMPAFTSSKRIVEVLDTKPDILEVKNAIKSFDNYDIEFKNVFFKYPKTDNFVLNDISFKLKTGESLGIIGEIGSGKSSIIQLIPRFYDASQGQILLGGKDIKNYDISSLENIISAVFQDISIFSQSVYENITFKNDTDITKYDLEKVNNILKDCSLEEVVSNLENGIHTKLSEEGKNLSGGQRQRLALARALYNDFKILILDDTTSAIDKITEKNIQNVLNTKYNDISKIIISQKISSIISCDKILVLNSEGKIDGLGTHTELINTSKIYREIYESQANVLRRDNV